MKKKYTVALFLSIFIVFSIFSAANGVETSDYIFDYLKKSSFAPKRQNLVSPGINNFPYNIYLYFPAAETPDIPPESKDCIVYVFNQMQFEKNKSLLNDFLQFLKQEFSESNTYILFSYDDNTLLDKSDSSNIYGSKIFIDSINSGQEIFTLFFDFESSINTIQSFTDGYTAPSNMLHRIYNCAIKSKIKFKIPYFYITQICSLNFSNNYLMSLFFKENIPNIFIKINGQNINQTDISHFLKDCAETFSKSISSNFDIHFLLFKVTPNHYGKISEKTIVISIVLVIFIFLAFIFIYFFIMHRRQTENWKKIRKIWYSLPFTYFSLFLSLLLGKFFSSIFINNQSDISKFIITFNFQALIALILVFTFTTITLIYNKNVKAEAIDFLVILSTFINQFIFLLVDISLFPLFMIMCIIALFSQFFTNKYLKILFFFLMPLPLFLYFNNLILSMMNVSNFYNSIFTPLSLVLISLALYPVFILIIRIICSFSSSNNSNKKIILINTTAFLSMAIITIVLSVISIYEINKLKIENPISIINSDSDEIIIKYYDKDIFDNKIRTLNITIPENSEKCKIKITAKNGNPILYSENSYFTENANTAYFLIPQNPPKELTFSYGIPMGESEIQVINYVKKQEYEFYRLEKSYIIE